MLYMYKWHLKRILSTLGEIQVHGPVSSDVANSHMSNIQSTFPQVSPPPHQLNEQLGVSLRRWFLA